MGRRGPKPIPSAILRARGSWLAPARAKRGEPVATDGKIVCPAEVRANKHAASWWDAMTPLAIAQGTLKPIDVTAWSEVALVHAERIENDELAACVEPGSIEWTRLKAVVARARSDYFKGCARFGLTPSDRAGLATEKPPEKRDDETDRFFQTG